MFNYYKCFSVTGTFGTFSSVNYPNNYFDDHEEQYSVSVEDGSKIALYFEVFDLEYHVACIYDYIEGNDSNQYLGKPPPKNTPCGGTLFKL